MAVFGVAIHQTGSGTVEHALHEGADPLEYAVAYYLKPDSYFAHYVIGYDGAIIQIADEHERAPHIGQNDTERQNYLSGAWEHVAGPKFTALWKHRWAGYQTPAHLYPGPSPNNAYVGIEMIPIITGVDDQPMHVGLLYTEAQHIAVARLAFDIAKRWNFPTGWGATGRLACHEDITPLSRMAKDAGWDPGVNRDTPWFNWVYLIDFLRQIRSGAMLAS
jgi:N-acetyl-anhydromuramyl-L-alanine amidase AmpD